MKKWWLPLKYRFCKKLLRYKWNSDQLNTFGSLFSKSVLIQCWFSSDLEKNKPKVCNWSEFHLNRSYFLQNPYFKKLNHSFYRKFGFNPSITDGVHRKENFVEINPVFSTFSKIFNNKIFFYIKAILCNFSMRLLKYF